MTYSICIDGGYKQYKTRIDKIYTRSWYLCGHVPSDTTAEPVYFNPAYILHSYSGYNNSTISQAYVMKQ